MSRVPRICLPAVGASIGLMAALTLGAQTPPPATPAASSNPAPRAARPAPPTRDPHTAGYVQAKELPDGENAPPDADGNFILGPTHKPAPEMAEGRSEER